MKTRGVVMVACWGLLVLGSESAVSRASASKRLVPFVMAGT